MRASTLALVSLLVAGCGGVVANPEGVVESSLGSPSQDPTRTCFGFCPTGGFPQPLSDPWNGERGYVIYAANPNWNSAYAVIGLDVTMTKWVWKRLAGSMADVNYYLGLPGTIPFSHPLNIEVGQVGSGNTNTGGGNIKCDTVCFDTPWFVALPQYQCRPEPAQAACFNQGYACGATVDNCKNPVDCGRCASGLVCQYGTCECKPRACPKGSYQGDGCACVKGEPI